MDRLWILRNVPTAVSAFAPVQRGRSHLKEICPGIYKKGKDLLTRNLNPGFRVYGERLIRIGENEYRVWNPFRSKLAAALLKGMPCVNFRAKRVLYLGAASGTTVSHVSDIVGSNGWVIAVEFSPQVFEQLLKLAERRENVIPILADARHPEQYEEIKNDFGPMDILYQDVAQPDQDDILLKNSVFLKEGGQALVAVKSQSIDVAEKPEVIYKRFEKKIKRRFKIQFSTDLRPFHKQHRFYLLRH